MSTANDRPTELLVYEDREEGFRGFLAYAGQAAPLAAGGFRVQKGLRGETMTALAEAMALKERVLALNVDGAKCGIDYDPASPGKHAAMRRFLHFLAPHLRGRLSLGPDMGTAFGEIEALARQEGIPSVKAAIARAQGLPRAEVLRRLELLDEPVGPLTLGQRRAGHALAQATLVALRHIGAPARPPRCALQGFGTLGRAAALSLHEAGVLITVIADEHGSVRCDAGLDVPRMLALPAGQPVAEYPCEGTQAERTAPLRLPVDAVVLAACEDAMTGPDAVELQAAAVVVGANRGLSDAVETLLHERGIAVVPDFVGGAGGSAAMDALFASPSAPDARSVLDRTAAVADVLTDRVLTRARTSGTSPRQAALVLAHEGRPAPDARPYGLRLLEPRRDDQPAAAPRDHRGAGMTAGSAIAPVRGCAHERGHITDSLFYGHNYATETSRRIFCDVCRYQRWLDIEAALALSQAELGLVPPEQAERIEEAAHVERLDLDLVRDEIRRTGHSLVGFLRALQDACEDGAGEFIHYGATTQDIQDTGQALEMSDVLREAEGDVAEIVGILAPLARSHAETLMVGRSHARAALPMTFGLKVASWIDELLRHAERLEECAARVAVAQLFGGVGTMAGFGGQGPALLERFAGRLGLGVPALSWHTARDRVAEYVGTVAALAATLARVLDEVRTLSRPEFGELEEAWRPGKVGSSTMPHKRNPEECQQVVVLARLAAAQVPLALQAMVGEHERDSRSLRLEWSMVAEVSHYSLAALAISRQVLGGLLVHDDVMAANAEDVAGAVCTESLMLALGRHMGKQTAHAHVYELCQDATTRGLPLREHLRSSPSVREHLSDGELGEIFEPTAHVGSAPELAAATAERAEWWLASRGSAARAAA